MRWPERTSRGKEILGTPSHPDSPAGPGPGEVRGGIRPPGDKALHATVVMRRARSVKAS